MWTTYVQKGHHVDINNNDNNKVGLSGSDEKMFFFIWRKDGIWKYENIYDIFPAL